MLRAHADVGAINPALQHAPEAFERVHGGAIRSDVFLDAVVDRLVRVAKVTERPVAAAFVGVNLGARKDERLHLREQIDLAGGCHNASY